MKSRHLTTPLHHVASRGHTCPQCGGGGVRTSRCQHTFRYGSGESAVDLTVGLPLRRCGSCEFEFLDDEAEHLKHEAVCKHLGVLSPVDIRRIRNSHGMTRADFAQVTGLGTATLNRWENGILIQTIANDRYIRLLARPEIMEKLKSLGLAVQTSSFPSNGNRFRMLDMSDDVRRDQAEFQLRVA